MLIVADSSALIALATCNGLDLIVQLYEEVKVPQAVYAEIVAPEKAQADILGTFLSNRVVQIDPTRWVLAAGGRGRERRQAERLMAV
jgi:predicted nucleic acid-binding protein